MQKTVEWLLRNINKNEGVIISDKQRMSYPEVSGYLIPTLLDLGYKKEAVDVGLWLSSIQNEDGSIPLGPNKFTFDTAMVISGWRALGGFTAERKKACTFLLSQVDAIGKISTAYHDQYVPEKILLWCATLLELEGHDATSVWNYYLGKDRIMKTLEFDCLSHFHCYVLDACFEAGVEKETVIRAIRELASRQRSDGSIPAYSGVNWVCYTGVAQAALLFYKAGLVAEGNRALKYISGVVRPDGGILGSNGDYFPDHEISWASKFYVDAYSMMIEKEMDRQSKEFFEWVDDRDPRVLTLAGAFAGQNLKLLEIGCGRGRYAKRLEFPSNTITGVDISANLVGECSNFMDARKARATNLPFPGNLFDGAYSVEVFEHFPHQLENGIREAARILKPGGTFVLIDKDNRISGGREVWEDWFDKAAVTSIMKKYFAQVEANNITELFIAWVGKKAEKLEMDQYEGRRILDEMNCILKAFTDRICLIQGTALGAYREGGRFVQGDHDIDLLLPGLTEFPADLLNELSHRGFVVKEALPGWFLSVVKNGVIVDMQLGVDSDRGYVLNTPVTEDVYPSDIFSRFRRIKLYNNSYLVPQDIEEYFRLTYGSGWRTPKMYTDRDNLMFRRWKI